MATTFSTTNQNVQTTGKPSVTPGTAAPDCAATTKQLFGILNLTETLGTITAARTRLALMTL